MYGKEWWDCGLHAPGVWHVLDVRDERHALHAHVWVIIGEHIMGISDSTDYIWVMVFVPRIPGWSVGFSWSSWDWKCFFLGAPSSFLTTASAVVCCVQGSIFDQPGKNPFKYSAIAGNWIRTTRRADSEIHQFSHWTIMTRRPGPWRGPTVRYIRSPTEPSWPMPRKGQTVRYIHSPTELSWLSNLATLICAVNQQSIFRVMSHVWRSVGNNFTLREFQSSWPS